MNTEQFPGYDDPDSYKIEPHEFLSFTLVYKDSIGTLLFFYELANLGGTIFLHFKPFDENMKDLELNDKSLPWINKAFDRVKKYLGTAGAEVHRSG